MDVRLAKIKQSQQQLNPNDQSIILDYRTQKANAQQITEFAKRCQQIDPNDEYELNIQSIDLDNYQNTSPYQFVTQMGPREVAARLEKIINRLLGKIEFAAKQTCTYITLAVTNDNNNEISQQKNEDIKQNDKNNNNNNNNDNDNKQDENDDDNIVVCQVQQYEIKSDETPTRYLVVFRRFKGSILDYNLFIQQLFDSEITEIVDSEFVLHQNDDDKNIDDDDDDDDADDDQNNNANDDSNGGGFDSDKKI